MYFIGDIQCYGDSYLTNRGLSVFDSPKLLEYTYLKEILLYHRLKKYQRTFRVNLQSINSLFNILCVVRKDNFSHFEYNQHVNAKRFPGLGDSHPSVSKLKIQLIDALRSTYLRRTRIMVKNIAFHVPDSPENVIRGGLLGLLIIQVTYNISIKFFSEGFITRHDIFQRKKSLYYKNSCTIDSIDVLALASHALKLKWYGSAVLFSNHYQHMYRKYPNKRDAIYSSNVQELAANVMMLAHHKPTKDDKFDKNNLKFLPFSSKYNYFGQIR